MSKAPASTTSAQATDEQISKLFDLLRPDIKKSVITSESLQKILEREKELNISSRFVTLLEQSLIEISDSVIVRVTYDWDAVREAISAARFDRTYGSIELIPVKWNDKIEGVEEVDYEVFELHLHRQLRSRDLLIELGSRPFQFTDPLTAICYAAKLPDRQRKYPLGVLFNSGWGQLCCLRMDYAVNTGRQLKIAFDGPKYWRWWEEECRFLVVRLQEEDR